MHENEYSRDLTCYLPFPHDLIEGSKSPTPHDPNMPHTKTTTTKPVPERSGWGWVLVYTRPIAILKAPCNFYTYLGRFLGSVRPCLNSNVGPT